MSRTCWIAALTVILIPLAAAAQEYTIKLARPAPGEQSQVKADNVTDVEFKLLDANGAAVMEKQEKKGHNFIFREVAVERGAGSDLVKLRRTYKKAARIVDGERRTLPFQGETVAIEKKDGTFSFQIIDGEAVEGEDARELQEEFNKGHAGKMVELFTTRKSVKLNESFTFDVAGLVKDFMKDGKLEIDAAKSTGVAKLAKVYQKNGKQFGVMEMTVTLPVTHFNHEDNKKPTKEGSKIVIKIEADRTIDGSVAEQQVNVSLDGDIKGEITANGMDFGIEVMIHASVEEHRTPVAASR
jgi:hypothetical protein